MGCGAFHKSGIEHIVLPDKPGIIIDGGAFDQCPNLKKIFIPEGYDISIASGLFSSCEALIEVTIGEEVTTIPSSCFDRCIALKKVVLPSTISMIQTNILGTDIHIYTGNPSVLGGISF
ncbi:MULTISPECIES: leucine-rich repeat domain-containing protein [Bacteroides]|uniref:leucine-rich repeat domain-containing protein n=1 Tax=Bacteroides TaxID=816 RepID=UPI00351B0EA1